jgi:flagellar basal-body rod protein FlgB
MQVFAMIDGLTNSEAMPVLERLMQFSGQRQRLIANNIANLSTPNFLPSNVSVEGFQQQLRQAVDERRSGRNSSGPGGDLALENSSEVTFLRDGVELTPQPMNDNILFHDGNDRNIERIMQDLVENMMVFRTAAQFHKSRIDLLTTAIRERM